MRLSDVAFPAALLAMARREGMTFGTFGLPEDVDDLGERPDLVGGPRRRGSFGGSFLRSVAVLSGG